MAKYHTYTDAQHAFIVKHQADIQRKDLAIMFNAKFGTNATTSMMNAYCRTRKLKSNSTGRFDIGGGTVAKAHILSRPNNAVLSRITRLSIRAKI